MLEFKTLEEMKPYFDEKTNVYRFDGDVRFCFDLCVNSSINAGNVNAMDIDALDINAENIDALDINAENIDAWNIKYYAFCIAYKTFSCRSVRGKRENAIHACLDGEIEYKEMNGRNEKGEAADV